jgi:hypothetical protein
MGTIESSTNNGLSLTQGMILIVGLILTVSLGYLGITCQESEAKKEVRAPAEPAFKQVEITDANKHCVKNSRKSEEGMYCADLIWVYGKPMTIEEHSYRQRKLWERPKKPMTYDQIVLIILFWTVAVPFILVVSGTIIFLPTVVAFCKNHPEKNMIMVANMGMTYMTGPWYILLGYAWNMKAGYELKNFIRSIR